MEMSINYGQSDFRQSLWVKGDAFQLQRVLNNLLMNAINHSRRGDRQFRKTFQLPPAISFNHQCV